MTTPAEHVIRRAEPADADAVGRLLHDFNREFDEPTPGPDQLARRIRQLLAEDHMIVLIGGEGPDGLAVLRFRPSIWSDGLECYLAELYVVPERRGRGLGTAGTAAVVERLAAMGRISSLYVNGFNHVARAAYHRIGFTQVGSFATVLF